MIHLLVLIQVALALTIGYTYVKVFNNFVCSPPKKTKKKP